MSPYITLPIGGVPMGKPYKEYSVGDVLRLGGYWLDSLEQRDALKYIFNTMSSFSIAPSEYALLSSFGTGDGNRIMVDKDKIREVISKMNNAPVVLNDTAVLRSALKAISGGELTKRLEAHNRVARQFDATSRLLGQYGKQLSMAKSALTGPTSTVIAEQLSSVCESTSWDLIGSKIVDGSTVLEFLQRTPTVLSFVDTNAMVNMSHDFGRMYCEVTVCTTISSVNVRGGYRITNSCGYIHPNVSARGFVCFGEGNADASRYMSTLDLCRLMSLLDRMLRTFSSGAPYHSVEEFIDDSTVISTLTKEQCRVAKVPYTPEDANVFAQSQLAEAGHYRIKPEFKEMYEAAGMFEARHGLEGMLTNARTDALVYSGHCFRVVDAIRTTDVTTAVTYNGVIYCGGKRLFSNGVMGHAISRVIEPSPLTPVEVSNTDMYALAYSESTLSIGIVLLDNCVPTRFVGVRGTDVFIHESVPSDTIIISRMVEDDPDACSSSRFEYNKTKRSILYRNARCVAFIADSTDVTVVEDGDDIDDDGYTPISTGE